MHFAWRHPSVCPLTEVFRVQWETRASQECNLRIATGTDWFKGTRSRHAMRPPKGWKDGIPARGTVFCCCLGRHLFRSFKTNPRHRIFPAKAAQRFVHDAQFFVFFKWLWFLSFRKSHDLLLNNPWVLKPLNVLMCAQYGMSLENLAWSAVTKLLNTKLTLFFGKSSLKNVIYCLWDRMIISQWPFRCLVLCLVLAPKFVMNYRVRKPREYFIHI